MTGKISRWYAETVATHSKLVVLVVLLLTGVVAAGVAFGDMEDAGLGEFEVDSPETEATEFVRANFGTDEGVRSQLVVREEGGTVLTRESLVAGLELQRDAAREASISRTLSEQGFLGIENLVAVAAIDSDRETLPPIDDQIAALEGLTDEQFDSLLAAVLDPDQSAQSVGDPAGFLPRGYEPGSTTAESRLVTLTQVDDSGEGEEPQAAYDAQVEIASLVDERFADAFVFGQGISNAASSQATGDSFAIITPFALALVLFVLGIAYRDVLDILLAFVGIGIVLAWLAGLMGWLAIPMNVILIAVPFLLIGLSIDYALHVVMRYREARRGTLGNQQRGDASESDGTFSPATTVRAAMTVGLGTVVLALAAATFSTGVGFLSNVVSPLPAIQDFAVLSAGGIFATFVAFGLFVPALKIELDTFVEERLGRRRDRPAFGVSGGPANRLLTGLAGLASRAPVAVIVVALLLATAGAYGATTIDTEFNEADFLPEDAPAWASYLPGPFQPGSYTISDDFAYLTENFQIGGERGQSQILVQGNVTDGSFLTATDTAVAGVSEDSAIQFRPDSTPAIDSQNTLIRSAAAQNETVAGAIDDTSGDGLPEENVAAVYALLFAVDEEQTSAVLSRGADGEVTAALLTLSVRGGESAQTIADDTRAVATDIEAHSEVTATAAGATVETAVLQDALLDTLVDAFLVTLVVILVFLTALFWVRYRAATLGAVVLLPVVVALAWLLGAMALLGIPYNSETAVITSLAIGLGADYSIHAGERFVTEREQRETLDEALVATITGTGGALFASAATTAGGFGVLALALAPPLQRFGLVTGSAIVLAFVAVVTLLPCLLVVRERLARRN